MAGAPQKDLPRTSKASKRGELSAACGHSATGRAFLVRGTLDGVWSARAGSQKDLAQRHEARRPKHCPCLGLAANVVHVCCAPADLLIGLTAGAGFRQWKSSGIFNACFFLTHHATPGKSFPKHRPPPGDEKAHPQIKTQQAESDRPKLTILEALCAHRHGLTPQLLNNQPKQ